MSNIQKALSSHPIFLMMFNSAYRANQPVDDYFQYGSRKYFTTDTSINGEYFRSRTNNQYFCVVNKNVKIEEINSYICDFRNLEDAIKIRKYNPKTDILLRLNFEKNKSYFVESYQAITIKNPDFTIVNIPLEELKKVIPKFEPLPN